MNKIILFLLGISLTLCACSTQPSVTQITGEGIGTYYKITIADKNNITQFQIDSLISVLNNTASIFNPNSLVSRINRNETDTLNAILKEILEVALQVSGKTDGAFDCTVGALVNLWGFGNAPQKEVTQQDVEKALETVGYKKIKIEGNKIVKENSETQLNFNAIAKGYCVDLVAAFLTGKNLENFLVDIGGELCIRGKRAPNQKWRVGIQKPTENREGGFVAEEIMDLQDISVATSGNYRNYIEENGKRLGHTINPKTGYPETNDLLSATVLTPACALADAYATAFMVMGAEKANLFLTQHPEIELRCALITNH
ncbi:MAG: FAD:protein FMN transferase [Bacteroidetes bacterium]|nr:FAD:protein FMN transferase [Bacteroidota bacterium]MCL1968759.1 FAD:protein FMN transferase [Bacteroidota bacterium]